MTNSVLTQIKNKLQNLHFRINPKYKHLYIVGAFLGVMLIAGITAGFMTGKLVNPFSKAGYETTAPICLKYNIIKQTKNYVYTNNRTYSESECKPDTIYYYRNEHPDGCEYDKDKHLCKCYVYSEAQSKGDCIEWGCPSGYLKRTDPGTKAMICVKSTNDDHAKELCEKQGGTWAKKSHKCITPIPTRTPKPTITTTPRPVKNYKSLCNPTSRTCDTCCNSACQNENEQERECYNECIKGCRRYTDNEQELNQSQTPKPTIQECTTNSECMEKIKCDPRTQNYTCQKRNGNSHCVCTNKPPQPTSEPTNNNEGDNGTSGGGGTSSSGNTSGETSSGGTDSCDPTYKIPLSITSVTDTYHTCKNDVYTITYKIKIHADNADKKECGGGHFTLTAIFPSTVQFDSGATQTSKPAGKPVDNTVTWVNRYVWDNSDQTYTLTANIPKSQLRKSTLTTTFKITLGDHTKDGGTLQTSKTSNVGACYVTPTPTPTATTVDTPTPTETPTDTPTETPTPTSNTDDGTINDDTTNTDDTYYYPPNTGLLDEHPLIVVAFIAALAIFEATFGMFSKAIIKIKQFVD